MDLFFLQIVLLFIPGVIWERMDSRFGVNRPNAQFDILRRAFCFGLSAYAVLFLAVAFLNGMAAWISPTRPRIFELHMVNLSKDTYTLDAAIIREILTASGMALFLSIFWLYITNNKIPFRFMQKIGATKRFGDEDVWDFTFNSRRAEVEYVHLRDFENQLTYSGWVEVFSETGGTRELVLRDVVVSSMDGAVHYETPRLYVARAVDKMTIEFPYVGSQIEEASRGEQATPAGSTTNGA